MEQGHDNTRGETDGVTDPNAEVPGTSEARQEIQGPRIYVASLSDYNAGILHGRWLDATAQPEDIETQISEMLADSPTTKRYGDVAEEWAIHDYEGFGQAHLSEWEPILGISRLAQGIQNYGEAFSAWWTQEARADDDSGDVFTQFVEQFAGEYETFDQYGEQLLNDFGFDMDELTDVPEGLRPYISFDMEAWLRDLRIDGALTLVEGRNCVYVFWPD